MVLGQTDASATDQDTEGIHTGLFIGFVSVSGESKPWVGMLDTY